MSTPYTVADLLLDAAVASLTSPPTRRYVAAGARPTIDCEQVVAHVTGLVPSRSGATRQPGRAICVQFNLLSVCVSVARCHETTKDRKAPTPADLDASFKVILDDGWALYRGVDAIDFGDCTVMTGPDISWDRPGGGYVAVTACITLDIGAGPSGS